MKFLLLASGLVSLIGVTAAAMPQKPALRYYPAPEVMNAFANGAVLLSQGNYQIHTSKRTAPGVGEVHTKDTDLIYVIEGSASFVTGGTLIDPKKTAADEIRGAGGIAGGEERTLQKGDVIVVPANTPHWFRAVDGTVLYYTIKVR